MVFVIYSCCVDVVIRENAEWVIEIHGFLGILNILGQEHLMVITGMGEVCKIYHKHQISYNQPSIIFELQEIDLLPFDRIQDP